MDTPSSLTQSVPLRFKQIQLNADTVIDLRVDKDGDQYRFSATEWTIGPNGTGAGASRGGDVYKSEAEATARFEEYETGWE